jgi:hypothetical protein
MPDVAWPRDIDSADRMVNRLEQNLDRLRAVLADIQGGATLMTPTAWAGIYAIDERIGYMSNVLDRFEGGSDVHWTMFVGEHPELEGVLDAEGRLRGRDGV